MDIIKTIKKHCSLALLNDDSTILVALSGGADSVALLYIMKQLGFSNILAAHINHGLRQAAIADETFCINLCKKLSIPIKTYQANVKGIAAEMSMSIEEAGRFLRYKFLRQACADFGVPTAKIATGHHQNDNAETVLLNLARGTGLKGLGGIPPTNGNIIRPLLNVSRADIENYLTEIGETYVTDHTNAKNDFARNRVRNIILPALETINPKATQNIAKNTEWLRDEENYLNSVAEKVYANISSPDTPITLDAAKLSATDVAIARRVVRLALGSAGLVDISSSHITAVLSLASKKSGHVIHLAEFIVRKKYSFICIEPKKILQKFGTYKLTVPSRLYITELEAWLELSHEKNYAKHRENQNLLCTKLFDYDKVIDGLVLRPRQAGDKIIFSSRSGNFTKKVQDYFTDQKVPMDKRDHIPLLASGNDVLWILDEKSPTSAKFAYENSNPLAVSLWRDAYD